MNILLWVLQGLLAALFLMAGSTKVFHVRESLAAGRLEQGASP
jgi:uncharacterized membrane protein YphA (DoxX/SURF4 family)